MRQKEIKDNFKVLDLSRRMKFSLVSWRKMLDKGGFLEREIRSSVLRSLLCIQVEILGRQLDIQVCIVGRSWS